MDAPAVSVREPQFGLAVRAEVSVAGLATERARLIARASAYAASRKAVVSGAPFLRYLGFSEGGRLLVEGGVPTLDPMDGDGDVAAVELDGGECVSVLACGPPAQLFEAHAALDEWFELSGRHPAGCRWEAWLDGSDPARARTLITQKLAAE